MIIAALLVVGSVSHGVVRHIVQTAPLWGGIVLGLRRSDFAKWFALPLFVFWLCAMAMIWLFLLGWVRLISGHFSSIEVAMTLVVGAASLVGIVYCLRTRTSVKPLAASAAFVGCALLQLLAFRLSLLRAIAHR